MQFKNLGNFENALLIAAILTISSVFIYLVAIGIIKRFSRRDDNQLESNAHKKFRIPILIFLLSIALNVLVALIDNDQAVYKYLKQFSNIFIILGITLMLIRIINLGKNLVLKKYDVNQKDNLEARKVYTQFKIIERILIAIVIIIALSAALMTFDGIRQIGVSIFASAGIAGIIIGFAAQKLLGNVLAGIQIAIAQPMRLDDVVIVEGEWGRIEEITITYVVIRIWDKRRLIVPTTYFIEKPFQNWTRESSEILGTVFVYTDYTVPFDKVRKELSRILKSDKNWDGITNNIQVTNATDRTVEIRALMSSFDASAAWDLRVNVREQLIVFLQKNYPNSLPRTRLIIEKDSSESILKN
jgi:small-conductance mechanosensitive channel